MPGAKSAQDFCREQAPGALRDLLWESGAGLTGGNLGADANARSSRRWTTAKSLTVRCKGSAPS